MTKNEVERKWLTWTCQYPQLPSPLSRAKFPPVPRETKEGVIKIGCRKRRPMTVAKVEPGSTFAMNRCDSMRQLATACDRGLQGFPLTQSFSHLFASHVAAMFHSINRASVCFLVFIWLLLLESLFLFAVYWSKGICEVCLLFLR